MAEESVAVSPGGINRRTIIIIAAAGLAGILLLVGIMMGILYLSGALNSNDELIERLNAIEGGGAAMSSDSEEDPNAPQLLELPDTNRLDTLFVIPGALCSTNSRSKCFERHGWYWSQ